MGYSLTHDHERVMSLLRITRPRRAGSSDRGIKRRCRIGSGRRACGVVGVLLSTLATAQGFIGFDQPTSFIGPRAEPMMMPVVPYADEAYPQSGVAPTLPYASCYRMGRCSLNDLYRFRDRPDRLTRLAPQAPPESAPWAPSVQHMWSLVPVTPEENILPAYRTASQVRDEYRAVSRPIEDRD